MKKILLNLAILMLFSVIKAYAVDVSSFSYFNQLWQAGGTQNVNLTGNITFTGKLGAVGANLRMNITGNGFTLNGANNYGLKLNNSSVTVNGAITFRNFSSTTTDNGLGVVIYNSSSSLTFSNSNVTFNSNTTSNGGVAIYNDNASNVLFNSSTAVFSSNTASGYYGGAIYNGNGSRITFTNTSVIFSSNAAASAYYGYGGAIFNSYYSTITFTGANVIFSSNTASGRGGAIANDNLITFTNINVTFNGNTARSNYGCGGAISNSANMSFSGSTVTFSGNMANSSNGNGGAVYNEYGSAITFTNSKAVFDNNAASNGGAIYNTYDSTVTFTNANVTFSSNTANNNGGAVYNGNSTVIGFNSSAVSFVNNRAGLGGALYSAGGANTSFSGGEVIFDGNIAVSSGGALYITASTVSFNTNAGNVLFTGNKAAGKPNDVYLGINGKLNISGSNAIRFEGGILSDYSGTGIAINKSGTGAMYLGGTNEIWGDFNITGGDIILLDNATYRGKELRLGNTGRLDMHNGSTNTITVSGLFQSSTSLKMDIFANGKGNDRIIASTAVISGNLEIFAGVGTYSNALFELIITSGAANLLYNPATNGIINSGGSSLSYQFIYNDGSGILKLLVNGQVTAYTYNFSALGLTYNQSETARSFNTFDIGIANSGKWEMMLNAMSSKLESGTESAIAEVKDFLSQVSGYFISNIVRSMASDSPNNEVYDKIRNHKEDYKTNSGLWVQFQGGMENLEKDENSPEDYKNVSMGAVFGFDRFLTEKMGGELMWGMFGRVIKSNAEQEENRAEGNKNGFGVYGGYLRNYWELKCMLLGSYDNFSTERKTYEGDIAEADINAITVSGDLELSGAIVLTESIFLRPYVGIEASNTMYEGFKEKGAGMYNLDVKEGSYLRSMGRVGAGFDYEKGRLIWYAKVEGKYIIEGTAPEIKSEFEETGIDFYSRGAEEGKIQIGAGVGTEIRVSENWKVFANAKYYTGENYENANGNIGIRFMFY
ncbi:MAG: autotransporter domain-containing protein [Endomicrobia bacterium]|nr:autotransporter domain-containing protein [Endomicrobiia bacterium]